MLAPHASPLNHSLVCYKNNSFLGSKHAGYRHICRGKNQVWRAVGKQTSPESVKTVGGNQDVILTIPGLAGFQMKVKANSVTFPDGSRVGTLVVSPVTADKLPMSPPGGAATFSAPAWTIQPAGTRFDPPIEVTLPNENGNPAVDNLPIVQWDHDLSQFVPMGRATVSEDGAVLVCDSGSGITKAGWGGGPPPPPPPKCQPSRPKDCNDCQKFDNGGGDCPTGQCVTDATKDETKLLSVNVGKISFSAELGSKVQMLTRTFGVIWDFKGEIAAGPLTGEQVCCSKKASGKAVNLEMNGVGGGFEAEVQVPLLMILNKLGGYIFANNLAGPTINIRLGFNAAGIRGAYDGCKNEGSAAGKIAANVEATISLANVKFPTTTSSVSVDPVGGEFRPLELGVNGQADWTLERWNDKGISGPYTLSTNLFGKSQFSIGTFGVSLIDISVPIFFSKGDLVVGVPYPL